MGIPRSIIKLQETRSAHAVVKMENNFDNKKGYILRVKLRTYGKTNIPRSIRHSHETHSMHTVVKLQNYFDYTS